MRKVILTASVATFLIGSSISLPGLPIKVDAATSQLQELYGQKNELDYKRSSIKSKIVDTNQEISRLKDEQAKLDEEIQRIDLSITKAEEQMLQKQEEVKETESDIANLRDEIKIIEERIEKRNKLLKERARSFQENGSMVSYIEVLMGSESFSNFIDRVSVVATIVEADQDILREHQADKELLEDTKEDLENKLENIQTMLRDLEILKQNLSSQKAEKDKLMASLQLEEEEIEKYKMELEEEEQLLSSQQSAIQMAIGLRQNSQADQNSVGGGGSTVSAPPVSSGYFTRPTSGVVTSGFGGRSGGNHYGVDIAKKGTVPIVSAADGVVIRSYYSSSYGNVVFISHSIEGQIYTTVYAHMSSSTVSAGEVVSKGQQIGYQGNTGQSFGQHLHFELHKGPWNAGKTNAINPAGIVPL